MANELHQRILTILEDKVRQLEKDNKDLKCRVAEDEKTIMQIQEDLVNLVIYKEQLMNRVDRRNDALISMIQRMKQGNIPIEPKWEAFYSQWQQLQVQGQGPLAQGTSQSQIRRPETVFSSPVDMAQDSIKTQYKSAAMQNAVKVRNWMHTSLPNDELSVVSDTDKIAMLEAKVEELQTELDNERDKEDAKDKLHQIAWKEMEIFGLTNLEDKETYKQKAEEYEGECQLVVDAVEIYNDTIAHRMNQHQKGFMDEIEEKFDTIGKMVDEKERKVAKLTKNVAKYKHTLQAKVRYANSLCQVEKDKTVAAKRRCRELQQELDRVGKEKFAILQDKLAAEKSFTETIGELIKVHKEKKQAEINDAIAQEKIISLEKEINDIKSTKTAKQKALTKVYQSKLEKEISDLKLENTAVQKSLSQTCGELAKVHQEREQAERDTAAAQEKISKLEKEINDVKLKNSAVQVPAASLPQAPAQGSSSELVEGHSVLIRLGPPVPEPPEPCFVKAVHIPQLERQVHFSTHHPQHRGDGHRGRKMYLE